VEWDRRYPYDEVLPPVIDAVEVLGDEYQGRMRQGLSGRWIDVYENEGKRSGAYSATLYGVHPYMLLNWSDTLDDVFTLAHEMGHSMHTMLAHERQPFVYSNYTIFVAEVPSTLSEMLLLEHLLGRATSREERIVLLQHAIDGITNTFYTQVLFADFELAAHVRVEQDEAITADVLSAMYRERFEAFYGDAADLEDLTSIMWARVPHLYNMPYYVYQYATCFASAASLMREMNGPEPARSAARDRYLALLGAGGSDQPMRLLQAAGIDLGEPATVQAVIDQMDGLVTRLEELV
jgi:oligoendopeptidase F